MALGRIPLTDQQIDELEALLAQAAPGQAPSDRRRPHSGCLIYRPGVPNPLVRRDLVWLDPDTVGDGRALSEWILRIADERLGAQAWHCLHGSTFDDPLPARNEAALLSVPMKGP